MGEYNMRGVSVNLQHQQSKGTLTGIMWQCKHTCPKIQYKTNKNHSHACTKIQYKLLFSLCIASFPNNIKIIPSAPPVTSTAQNSTKPHGLGFDCRQHNHFCSFSTNLFCLRKITLVNSPPRMGLIGVGPLV